MLAYKLADKYGHNRGTIMKHLAEAGVRSRVAVPTDDEIFHWQELHAQGPGVKSIANRVGRNHKTVNKYLSTWRVNFATHQHHRRRFFPKSSRTRELHPDRPHSHVLASPLTPDKSR